MKTISWMVRNRIFGEGQIAAMMDMKESDCKYDGDKRLIWLDGFRSVSED